jgi:hypothetical protein
MQVSGRSWLFEVDVVRCGCCTLLLHLACGLTLHCQLHRATAAAGFGQVLSGVTIRPADRGDVPRCALDDCANRARLPASPRNLTQPSTSSQTKIVCINGCLDPRDGDDMANVLRAGHNTTKRQFPTCSAWYLCLAGAGIASDALRTIRNWAPLNEVSGRACTQSLLGI